MFKDFVLMLAFLLPVSCFAASPGYQVSETVPVPAIIGLATTAFIASLDRP
jgi:hypothetical protein